MHSYIHNTCIHTYIHTYIKKENSIAPITHALSNILSSYGAFCDLCEALAEILDYILAIIIKSQRPDRHMSLDYC